MYKSELNATIREDVLAIMDKVLTWRRHLHQHPELSYKEVETTAFIKSVLEEIGGYELSYPMTTGVVATLKGGKPGKTVALRADIDALPVVEKTGLEFASLHEGCMHACGHDSHISILLGAAYLLAQMKDELPGTYKLMFQPAEENVPGGAKFYVEAGVLDDVDVVLGQHVMPHIPAGKVGLIPGPIMASADMLNVTVRGRGGHGAMHHLTIDPITISAQIINNMQLIASRETSPLDSVVVSMCNVHSGTTHNIVPETCTIQGTIRTFRDETRKRTAQRLEQITKGVAEANNATVEWDYQWGYPPTINDERVVNTLVDLIKTHCGEEVPIPVEPIMPAEDFAYYLQKVPGCFYFLGTGNPDKNCTYDLHNPKFRLDEDVIALGISVMITGALHFAGE